MAAPGSTLVRPERRVEHVVALRPGICSLDLNTMWFGNAVVINTPRNVTIMAGAIREAGVKPELEVFDSGDIVLAQEAIDVTLPARIPPRGSLHPVTETTEAIVDVLVGLGVPARSPVWARRRRTRAGRS